MDEEEEHSSGSDQEDQEDSEGVEVEEEAIPSMEEEELEGGMFGGWVWEDVSGELD